MNVHIDSNDIGLIIASLNMRANWIETGNPVLSMRDAIRMKKKEIIKDLSNDQINMVQQIRNLANDLLEEERK